MELGCRLQSGELRPKTAATSDRGPLEAYQATEVVVQAMPLNVERQVVVITGASSGIGRATAHAFSTKGAGLVLCGRDEAALSETAAECTRLGGAAHVCAADVSQEDEVQRLLESALAEFGHIDIWINGAAVLMAGHFKDQPVDAFKRVIEVNLFGYLMGSRAALAAFQANGNRGVLINIASMLGMVGEPYLSAYVASKHAIRGMTTCLRQEMGQYPGIRVVTIMPVAIDTPIYHNSANFTGRAMRSIIPVYGPERVARAIVKAARRGNGEIIVGTYGYALDIAMRLSPSLVNRLVGRLGPKLQFSHSASDRTMGNLHGGTNFHAVEGGWRTYWSRKIFGKRA